MQLRPDSRSSNVPKRPRNALGGPCANRNDLQAGQGGEQQPATGRGRHTLTRSHLQSSYRRVLQRVLRQRQRAELPAERGQGARALVAEQGDQGRAALGGVSRRRHRSRSPAGPRRSRCGPPEHGSRAAPPRRGRRTRAGRSRSGPPWSRRTARRSPRSWRTVVAVVVGYSAAPPRSTAATVWPKAPNSAMVCRFSSVSNALQSGSPGS